ncbi:MAG: endo-1,4-beta-xylanase [bacterium]
MSLSSDIKHNRFHDYEVSVPSGTVAARVRQTRHEYSFGTAAFALVGDPDSAELAEYEERLQRFMNFATLPFYWGRYEPVEGQPMEKETLAAAKWAREHGFTTKGHPLCWHTVCADWLLQCDNDMILQKQLDRIRRDVSLYRGVIDMWDVINEVVIMPVFDKYDNAVSRIANHIGAVELTLKCFEAARESNPEATLLINDFNLSPDYEHLIEELLDRGCPIGAIGLQTHQHQGYHGVEKTMDVIDRFARFGKPLHFTEITILSGHPVPPHITDLNDYQLEEWPSTPEGEERQREMVEEYYSAIFSRPETHAMIWWSPTDGGWLGAPAGLLRKDLSPKPAFERLEVLIRGEWWFSEQEVRAGADGKLHFAGVAGEYEIRIGETAHRVALGPENRNGIVHA